LKMKIIDCIMLTIASVGAINLGIMGAFNFDVLGWVSGGAGTIIARIVFAIVGIAALWTLSLLFRPRSAQSPVFNSHHH